MKIKLTIKNPIHRQYLRSISQQTVEGYKISSRTATGMLICALARSAYYPIKQSPNSETLDLILPINDITMPLRCKFAYIRPCDQSTIEAMLAKQFDVDFIGFIHETRFAGKTRKEGVEMFITKYHLEDVQSAFSTLTKKRYRATLYATRKFGEKLVKKAEYEARGSRSRGKRNSCKYVIN